MKRFLAVVSVVANLLSSAAPLQAQVRPGRPDKAPQREPRQDPRPPRQEPRPQPPRQDPRPPRQDPRPQPPRQDPRPPREEPRPQPPRQDPRPPREEPRPQPPRQDPRPQPPRQDPRPQPPRQDPRPPRHEPRPQPPRRDPRPEQPRQPTPRPPVFDPAPRRPDHRPGDRNPGRVIPRPNPIRDRDPIDRIHRDTDHRRFPNPVNAPGGHSPVTRAPHQREVLDHTVNNRELLDRIREHNRWETNRNHYYWHDYGGRRYCHYYDDYGYHWYGWWIGSSYYWTRYHYDRYWWYDPYYGRWVYYYGGSWWWHDPFAYTIVYIYRDGSYYRYEDAPGGVIIRPRPETPAPSPDPAPTQPEETSFYSADGTRMVQIFGDRKDAFLYDLTADEGSAEEKPKFLDKGVTAVSFGNDEKTDPDGTFRQPLRQIELTLEDGSKALVDPNGTRSVKLLGTDAYLYRLDSDAQPLFLAADAVQVKLFSEEKTGTDGTRTSSLELILLTRRDAGGNETLALFDPEGRLLSGEAGTPPADSGPSEPGPAPEDPGTPPGAPAEPNFDGRGRPVTSSEGVRS